MKEKFKVNYNNAELQTKNFLFFYWHNRVKTGRIILFVSWELSKSKNGEKKNYIIFDEPWLFKKF